jgi:hypothetical protein
MPGKEGIDVTDSRLSKERAWSSEKWKRDEGLYADLRVSDSANGRMMNFNGSGMRR